LTYRKILAYTRSYIVEFKGDCGGLIYYEENISTKSPAEAEETWFYEKNVDKSRAPDSEKQAFEGQKTSLRLMPL
jgi:hypothetical protein